MCGIIGIFSASDSADNIEKRIQEGIVSLRHRGPDDRGLEILRAGVGTLALGHARLAIIDLSAAGHQPMSSVDGAYTIVFNGEIYNYKELRDELKANGHTFISDSDTEVLIACWIEWGEDLFARLKGMFAFAILDHKRGILTCVRDAFGIKPFFYSFDDGEFCFASEVSALRASKLKPSKPNFQMIYEYLAFGGYDNQQATFYEEISHLLPGHMIKVDLNEPAKAEPKRWWFPSIAERRDISFEQATLKLRELFLDNVKLHLRSDVPVGAALSGGLDSSSVVCAMRYLEPDMPIHTFTYVAKNSSLDEEHWADIVNEAIGAIPHKVFVEPEDLVNDLDDMIAFQGEPFVGTSIYAQYRVFKSAKEQGIIVTLDGQGADELLAGYVGYPEARFKSLFEQKKLIEGVRFLFRWLEWPDRSKYYALKAFVMPFVPDWLYKRVNRWNIEKSIPSWINKECAEKLGVRLLNIPSDPHHNEYIKGRALMNTLRAAMTGAGLNSLLRHADRNAMRWSIESRVPFLTIDMAELLLSLPESYLISKDGKTKTIFREAMRGIVPDVILDRRDKVGFATPEPELLRRQKEDVYEWVTIAKELPFIDYEIFISEIKETLEGHRSYNKRIWRMINICRWMKAN